MERSDRPPVATFYVADLEREAAEVTLGAAAARHAAVRRLSEGEPIRLTDGAGLVAVGRIRAIARHEMVVKLRGIEEVPPLPRLEVLAPVADRERMLWLAEKCAELAITVWQPVVFSRSRSVVPRGEGEGFAAKVRARMVGALEQSGGAWLPEIRGELPLEKALTTVTASTRYVLDRAGIPMDATTAGHGAAVTFGPEGGIEPSEHDALLRAAWKPASLVPTALRFETAGLAAVAILRAGVCATNTER